VHEVAQHAYRQRGLLQRDREQPRVPRRESSADANRTGWSASPAVGFQAGVSDPGNRDEICENAISGAGFASLGATHSLPHPPAPAFVRPVDIVTGPAIQPETFGNTFDGRPYHPA
jgi:hypothetical protein